MRKAAAHEKMLPAAVQYGGRERFLLVWGDGSAVVFAGLHRIFNGTFPRRMAMAGKRQASPPGAGYIAFQRPCRLQ